ncbi:hypothetical protein HBI56_031630 [Parastagonospora nodorum]|nr:hypothetical protein HBH51_174490 [Parastagonospora nodorum]KAH4034806.1 hypothetical protein HBI09_103420 [Parastagonospora nodorum]KAH4059275.1 hypothetical protein HBH49_016040 [Parastagonospora nodorum]KAH4265225.1 hypothetical protein HBI03_082310 [Parastagonospora nodorum]KAH4283247.1 hypothetical protein HBI04_020720 [Parastagonospora nodorum]
MPISATTPSPTSLHSTHIHFTKSSTWIPHTFFFYTFDKCPREAIDTPTFFILQQRTIWLLPLSFNPEHSDITFFL